MNTIIDFWTGMPTPRKIAIVAASLFVAGAMLLLSQIGGNRANGLLYSGLEPAAAGEVIAALEGRGVIYDVDGNSIYVEQGKRDQLRMELAAQGLPTLGEQGYELLDGLSGFGTTSQMFDAAYWRAKEGELARTITAAPHIKSARVHISGGPSRPFQRSAGASASVTIGSVAGTLSADQARALRYLVAAAVSGMTPQDVSVIDRVGGLIAAGEDAPNAAGDDPRAEAIKAKAERLLEARVGRGNAVVELSLETVLETERITEHMIDPDSRVAVSSEVEERSSSNENGDGGAVTVASNLPDGDAAASSGASAARSSETRERTNFEISETQREITRGPGDIRRLSVAVLVNHVAVPGADGTTAFAPRSSEELQILKGLVASAVGIDESRGDVITIESLAFEATDAGGSGAAPAASLWSQFDMMQIVQFLLASFVVAIFGIFVLRPILNSSRVNESPLPQPDGTTQLSDDSMQALPEFNTAEQADDDGFADLDFSPPAELGGDLPMLGDFSLGVTNDEDPAERLRSLILERQPETLQVLQAWIDRTPGAAAEEL